jgi:hypothetical protein
MGGHIWANNASTCSTGNPSADGKTIFGGVTSETAPPPEGTFRNVPHIRMYTYLHTHMYMYVSCALCVVQKRCW